MCCRTFHCLFQTFPAYMTCFPGLRRSALARINRALFFATFLLFRVLPIAYFAHVHYHTTENVSLAGNNFRCVHASRFMMIYDDDDDVAATWRCQCCGSCSS